MFLLRHIVMAVLSSSESSTPTLPEFKIFLVYLSAAGPTGISPNESADGNLVLFDP